MTTLEWVGIGWSICLFISIICTASVKEELLVEDVLILLLIAPIMAMVMPFDVLSKYDIHKIKLWSK